MLISIKHNFVVILTPKCASNSIESILLPYSDIALLGLPPLRHTNYRLYSKYIKPYLAHTVGNDRIETVCVVREPLSWLNSHYRFRSRLEIRNPEHPNYNTSTFGMSFAEFIEAYMSPSPPPYAQFNSQFSFVQNESNEIGVDRIFLYEDIETFLKFMGDKLGKKLKAGYKNVSPSGGTETRTAAWIDYAKRKIAGRLDLRQLKNAPKDECEIPDDLLISLRRFIPNDFDLYERVKKAGNQYRHTS